MNSFGHRKNFLEREHSATDSSNGEMSLVEQTKAYLLQKESGQDQSLYEHLVDLVKHIAVEKPTESVRNLGQISRKVRQNKFSLVETQHEWNASQPQKRILSCCFL